MFGFCGFKRSVGWSSTRCSTCMSRPRALFLAGTEPPLRRKPRRARRRGLLRRAALQAPRASGDPVGQRPPGTAHSSGALDSVREIQIPQQAAQPCDHAARAVDPQDNADPAEFRRVFAGRPHRAGTGRRKEVDVVVRAGRSNPMAGRWSGVLLRVGAEALADPDGALRLERQHKLRRPGPLLLLSDLEPEAVRWPRCPEEQRRSVRVRGFRER